MPISQPCTTRECQEAALAALRADKDQRQGGDAPLSSGVGGTAGSGSGAPRGQATSAKPSPFGATTGNGPAAAITSAVRAAITSPPGTPASAGGRPATASLLGRAPGGSGAYSSDGPTSPGGPTSPNRTVRFSDEEEAARDNLHVGLSSRTSSADSLHRSYDAAAERREPGQLPPSAGGFHVLRTAGGKLEAVSSSARWEDVVGYSRAVKRGPFVFVSGTSAVDQETGRVMFRRDAYKQTQLALTIIEKALAQVGASLEDVTRTRLFVRNLARDGEAISRAHGNVLGTVKPASTMVEVSRLVHDDILVLIEADAVVGDF
ncbi:hypothetical protein ABPG75_011131 [Micractinium tetrahymenae]